jgi:hypothetical protein
MTPVLVALRRLRARPLQVAVVVVALAAAAALVGWSSLRAGVAQERNTRVRLAEVAPGRRTLTSSITWCPTVRASRRATSAASSGGSRR